MKIEDAILAYHHIHRTKHITIDGDTETVVSNLFVVAGLVRIIRLHGIVETATLGANVTDCWFDLFPTGGVSVPLTKEVGAPAMSAHEVGSAIIKAREAGEIATILRANVGMFLEEDADYKHPFKSFLVGKDSDAVTQIRFMYTTNADLGAETGVIHFGVIYEIITTGSKLTPA